MQFVILLDERHLATGARNKVGCRQNEEIGMTCDEINYTHLLSSALL